MSCGTAKGHVPFRELAPRWGDYVHPAGGGPVMLVVDVTPDGETALCALGDAHGAYGVADVPLPVRDLRRVQRATFPPIPSGVRS